MRKLMNGAFTVVVLAIFLFLLFVALTRAQASDIVASGGNFTVEKAALAGGGNEKQMLSLTEHGTSGQTMAGRTSSAGPFSMYSGFWTPENLVPTAANVSVGGRVTDHNGTGIRNVVVTITSQTGEVRSTLSSSFGYYRFQEVMVGETYLISVYSKRYSFFEPTRVLQVADEITDADFAAVPDE
ncbi:MAG TPA: carboxypeptidase-like regulatory domain-containing protein [Pyrinomonadaceae bacterium]